MARKIRLTRPELKRCRDALARYALYLPMLKLKQQQLQLALRQAARRAARAAQAVDEAARRFERYQVVLADVAGVPVERLAAPVQVTTTTDNVAGVRVPVFQEALFPPASYSLFGTPPWVDFTLTDLRELNRRRAELEVLRRACDTLGRELRRIVQRVNLFEKLKIPEMQEAIRVIRIYLGDEMAAAVGRAKIAKSRLAGLSATGSAAAAAEPEKTTGGA